MSIIEQWYAEQGQESRNWYDELSSSTKKIFEKHIEETWKFLDSVCISNGITKEQFESLSERERLALVGKQMVQTLH